MATAVFISKTAITQGPKTLFLSDPDNETPAIEEISREREKTSSYAAGSKRVLFGF